MAFLVVAFGVRCLFQHIYTRQAMPDLELFRSSALPQLGAIYAKTYWALLLYFGVRVYLPWHIFQGTTSALISRHQVLLGSTNILFFLDQVSWTTLFFSFVGQMPILSHKHQHDLEPNTITVARRQPNFL